MKLNTIFLTMVVTPSVGTGLVINHALHHLKTTKSTTATVYHTHAEQMTHVDGDDVNTNFDKVVWKNVNFEQQFKNIYLSNKNEYVFADKSMISLKQTNVCTDNKDSGTCGGKGYEWDKNTRIHDWSNDFHDNLYLKLDENAPEFGHIKQKLYLKEKKLLGPKQSYHSLTCPTMFGHLYQHASDINFGVGVHRDLHSGNWSVYGVNKAWLKETAHVAIFYNWVDRFLWTLNAGDAPHQDNLPVADDGYGVINIDEGGVDASTYNINHLFKISDTDYENKNIKLALNDEFIQFAKDWHEGLNKIPYEQLTPSQQLLMDKYNFTSESDPWKIFEELKGSLTFEIEYRINDPIKFDRFKNEKIEADYGQLKKGIQIHLNKNEFDKYLIQFTKISCLEVVTPDLYVQGCSTKNITQNNSQIAHVDNGFYELQSPKIANIQFKDYDKNKLGNIYPSSLDDSEILKIFVTLIDTYGKTDDYSLLTNEMYAIQRNDFDGNITININVDNFHLSQTFDGFKQANSQSHELDASKVAFNIIASELSNAKINNILVANGFSQNIINDSSFDIKNIDDITGSALITATNGPLSNTSYKIINLQPYYIRLKDNIPKKYLIGKPSDIDIGVLKERYLDISNEFWSRNQEKLSFSLDPNNNTKTLTVHVTYYEDLNNKFVKLDLNISFTNKTNNLLIILLASVMSVLLLACVFVLVHKKLKKRKHVSLD